MKAERPTARAPHVLGAALCLGLVLPLATPPVGIAAGLVSLAFALLALVTRRWRLPLLALALALTGWWWGSLRLQSIDRSTLATAIGSSGAARLEVAGPPRRSAFSIRVPVEVLSFRGRNVAEPALLELPAAERAPPQGAVLSLSVEIRAPRGPDRRSSFDEATYLRRRGVHVVLRGATYEIVGRRGGLAGIADRIRSSLSDTIAPGLTGERRALVAGIVLGEDEGLDAGLRDDFRASGLYHLLAVSGQNVAYVVAGVLILAWVGGVPRLVAQGLALGAIVSYVLAVGWQPSVVRAGIAGGLTSLAWLAARPRDRWYSFLVGAAVLLAWSPYSFLDPGFQLSFSAVAAIFLVVPVLERRLEGYPIPRTLATILAVSTGCGIVTAPILWLQFGSVPVLSVPANAMAEPVVAPILALGLGSAVLSPLLPGAALALGWLNGWLVSYLAFCARLVGGLPFARVSSGPLLIGVAAGAGALVVVARAPKHRRSLFVAATVVAAALSVGWAFLPRAAGASPPSGLRISFLDVGQGDAELLQVPEGAVLVDEGPPEADVADRLIQLGVTRLAAIVMTHPQRDHVGGAAEVLRKLEVGEVLDPEQPNPNPFESEALGVARDRHVSVVPARSGETFRLGRLRLVVLWPDGPGPPGDDPNNHAVVLLASYGSADALLTADAESDVTGRLRLPTAEILKVAHHGSDDPGLADLLARVRPQIAVISVGADNSYGHPAPSTIAALTARPGLSLYRTDREGTVVVESNGAGLDVTTER